MYGSLRYSLSNEPVTILARALEKFPAILKSYRKIAFILHGNCSRRLPEIHLLLKTWQQGVPDELLQYKKEYNGKVQALVSQLKVKYPFKEHEAQWAVESWDKVLQVLDEQAPKMETKEAVNGKKILPPAGKTSVPSSERRFEANIKWRYVGCHRV